MVWLLGTNKCSYEPFLTNRVRTTNLRMQTSRRQHTEGHTSNTYELKLSLQV